MDNPDEILESLDFDESYSDIVQSSLFYVGANLSIFEEALYRIYTQDVFGTMVWVSSLAYMGEAKLQLLTQFILSSFYAMADDYFGPNGYAEFAYFCEVNEKYLNTIPVTEYAWKVLIDEVFVSPEQANQQMIEVIEIFYQTSSLGDQLLFVNQACKLSSALLSKMYVLRNKRFGKITYGNFLSEVMLRLREAHAASIFEEGEE